MHDRRQILRGLAMATVLLNSPSCIAAVKRGTAGPGRRACAAAAGSTAALPDLLASTGNEMLDRQLLATSEDVFSVLGVDPSVGLMDDSRAPNDLTLDGAMEGVLRVGRSCTVLLGLTITIEALADNHWGADVVRAMIAHEAAHVLQFDTGLYNQLKRGQPNERLIELHADYLAGYCLGRTAMVQNVFYDLVRDSFYLQGDTEFQNPHHHGTPEERVSALTAGFDVARDTVDAATASAAGSRYVRALAG